MFGEINKLISRVGLSTLWKDWLSMVGSSGLEPPTLRLSGVRSNHLSYEPILIRPAVVLPYPHPLVEMRRIELLTPCVQGRCSPS